MANEETKTEEIKSAQGGPASGGEETTKEQVSSEQKGAGLRFKKSRGVCRKCRRAGEKLFLKGERCSTAKCSYTRRSYIAGQHGNKGMRRMSQYGLQLREKQKLAAIYGLREKQLLKYFRTASNKKGKTGEILMSLLERRLDNIVFRAALASSRREARQKVKIRKLKLNGRSIDIPSILIKKGDAVSFKDLKKGKADLPKWLELDVKSKAIKIIRLPDRDDIYEPINEQLVVEFYSK